MGSVRVVLAVLLSNAAAFAAGAATITNRDKSPYTVAVVEPLGVTNHDLAPGASLLQLCPKGCIIRLNGAQTNAYELEGADIVAIVDGAVYFDGAASKAPSPIAPLTRAPGSRGSDPARRRK